MGRSLGKVSDLVDERQLAQDKTLLEKNTPEAAKAWREAHSENGTLWRGALLGLGVVFPQAAQLEKADVWQGYQSQIYTLAGQIEDRRTRGQLLVAGYRAIPLEEIDPLTKDFDTFFQRRAEYKAALNPEDRALLDRTLEATMTPVEKEYARDQETLRPYWGIREVQLRSLPVVMGNVFGQWIDKNEAYREAMTSWERENLRRKDAKVQAAGEKWGYFGKAPTGRPSFPPRPQQPSFPARGVPVGAR